jgi:hypothetical protein
MARYRRRPMIVEAEQWIPTWDIGVPPVIQTPEGEVEVRPGDWILTERNGDQWRYGRDAFHDDFIPYTTPSPIGISPELEKLFIQWIDISVELEKKTDDELAKLLSMAADDVDIDHPVYGLLEEASRRLGGGGE